MRISIRLLILLVVAALPIFALQVHGLLEGREERKAKIAQRALDLARLAAAQQDQFIEGAHYLLAAAAELPEVQNRDSAACDRRMAEFLRLFPNIAGIGAVGPDGVQFCSAVGADPAINLADRAYFQEAMGRKALVISGFIIGRRTQQPNLNFAYPALNDAGEVRAIVILGYSLDRLSESLSARPLPADATISLIDGDGILLARAPPAPDRIGNRVWEAAFTEAVLERREGVIEALGPDGVERQYGFAPLLSSADLFAIVGLPWQAAFHEADRMFWRDVIVTALSFVLAALLALLIGEHWIRSPRSSRRSGAWRAAICRRALT